MILSEKYMICAKLSQDFSCVDNGPAEENEIRGSGSGELSYSEEAALIETIAALVPL